MLRKPTALSTFKQHRIFLFKEHSLPNMFSTIALIISVVGFISDASGFVRERRSAYEAALKYSKAGWNADISELQKEGSGSPPDKADCWRLPAYTQGYELVQYTHPHSPPGLEHVTRIH